MKNTSLKAISQEYWRNKFPHEVHGDWGSAIFYRTPAFVLARLAIAVGLSPSALTLTGLLMTLAMPLIAWKATPDVALPWVIVLAVLYNIFDCADGPVARATKASSAAGAYLDVTVDVFYRAVCLGTLGWMAGPASFALGLMAGLCATYARLNRLEFERRARKPSSEKPSAGYMALVFSGLSGLDTLMPILALLAWALGHLPALMIGLFIYHGADALIAVLEAYFTLRRSAPAKAAARP